MQVRDKKPDLCNAPLCLIYLPTFFSVYYEFAAYDPELLLRLFYSEWQRAKSDSASHDVDEVYQSTRMHGSTYLEVWKNFGIFMILFSTFSRHS